MFGNVLITPTLLDSFDFLMTAPPNWKQRANKDFIAKIRREEITYPEWVQKGQDFEEIVYKVCNKYDKDKALTKGSKSFQKVVDHCHGGTFQNKLSKNYTIDDTECYFFGFSDVEFPELTIDIKTCLKWKGPDKYLAKNQHVMYPWLNGKKKFNYLIVEWDNIEEDTIKSVNLVEYTAPSDESLETIISRKVRSLFSYLHSEGLWNDFYYTFSKN